jgi:hypothetical protein
MSGINPPLAILDRSEGIPARRALHQISSQRKMAEMEIWCPFVGQLVNEAKSRGLPKRPSSHLV